MSNGISKKIKPNGDSVDTFPHTNGEVESKKERPPTGEVLALQFKMARSSTSDNNMWGRVLREIAAVIAAKKTSSK